MFLDWPRSNHVYLTFLFFKRLITKKVCTAFSRTSYKIVSLTNLNKYLYNYKSEIKVNINVYNNS